MNGRIYAVDLHRPLVLTADDGTPHVVTTHCEDDGRVVFEIRQFEDRTLADIFVYSQEETDVIDEIKRRKRAEARKQPERAALPPDEPVSVIRLLEYRGPRTWIEETVSRSIHGTRIIERGKTITGVTVGDFPRRI